MNKKTDQANSPKTPKADVYASYEPNFVPSGYNVVELSKSSSDHKDRRKHRRIPSRNGKACIICDGKQQIVEMLNVSRGGLYIRTSVPYPVGTFIQVAAHYVEGANNIFLPARIVRAHLAATSTLPGEYGIEMLKSVSQR